MIDAYEEGNEKMKEIVRKFDENLSLKANKS